MTQSNSPPNHPYQDDVAKAMEGLEHLNGAADHGKVLELYEGTILTKRLDKAARQRMDAADRPDFRSHLKDGNALAAQYQTESARYLVEKVTDWGSTTLVVAPTNSGGSTLLLHMAYCLLTGRPFLDRLDVDPGPFAVLWINPEESETTPASRLLKMGTTAAQRAQFHHLHTRDQRLYFNKPGHVAAMLETVEGMNTDGLPLVVFVDGFTPTLSGTPWNEDLEAWKDGVGQMREALNPVGLYVRSQVLSAGARSSIRGTRPLNMEDAAGGQISAWPDNRLTLNRVKDSDERVLTVRGRLQDAEWTIQYEWDARTYLLHETGSTPNLIADMAVRRFLGGTDDDWRTIQDGLTSKRKVAAFLHKDLAALRGVDSAPSVRTLERALQEWEYDAEADKWGRK